MLVRLTKWRNMLNDELMQILVVVNQKWKSKEKDKQLYEGFIKNNKERIKNVNGWYSEEDIKRFKKDIKKYKKEVENYQIEISVIISVLLDISRKVNITLSDIWNYEQEHKEDK